MKQYSADQLIPTNSNARKPEQEILPPWFFKGRPKPGLSGEWSPKYMIQITGGKAISVSAEAYGDTGIVIVKNNPFVKNEIVGQGLLRGWAEGLLEANIAIENPMAGGAIVGPYDRLQVVIFTSGGRSPHYDITVQLTGDVIG